jgi:hypothetical protein
MTNIFPIEEYNTYSVVKEKGKAVPVTGHEGPQGCETLRLQHLPDNRFTDAGKVVSITY